MLLTLNESPSGSKSFDVTNICTACPESVRAQRRCGRPVRSQRTQPARSGTATASVVGTVIASRVIRHPHARPTVALLPPFDAEPRVRPIRPSPDFMANLLTDGDQTHDPKSATGPISPLLTTGGQWPTSDSGASDNTQRF